MKTDGCAYLHEAMESSGNGKCVGERHLSALPATEESLPLSRISNPPLWAIASINALFLKAHLLSSPAQSLSFVREPGLVVPTLCSPVCFSLQPEPQLPLHSSTQALRLWLSLLSILWMGRCWEQLEKYYCVPSLFPVKIKACFQFSDSPPF